MTRNENQKLSLDAVLAQIAASPTPPDAAQTRTWIERYPQYKAEIINFATDWVELNAHAAPETTQEDVDLVVNRTMSRVQQLLDEGERTQSLNDLVADIKAAGHDLDSFQQAVGIDRSVLTCLSERMIRPSTIPLRLVTTMANVLGRAVDLVRDYLRLPPRPLAAFKATNRPQPKQVDFAFVIEHAELPQAQKARWLKEPPDPDLRD